MERLFKKPVEAMPVNGTLDLGNPVFLQKARKSGFETGRVFVEPETFRFFSDAKAAGAFEALRSWLSPGEFSLSLEITWFYLFTDATFGDIAQAVVNSIGEDSVRIRFKNVLRILHEDCPDSVRRKHPIDQIETRKLGSQKHRDRISRARGGKRQEARELLLKEGFKNYRELASRLNISEGSAQNLLSKLRLQGFGQESRVKANKRIRRAVFEAKTPADFREILEQVSPSFISRNRDLFASIMPVVRDAGFVFEPRQFPQIVRALRTAGVPFRVVRERRKDGNGNYFIKQRFYLVRGQERMVVEALNSSSQLAHLRSRVISQLSGEKGPLPRARDLKDRNRYKRFLPLIKREGLTLKQILRGCPVAIFEWRRDDSSWVLVRTDDFEALIEHARRIKAEGNGRSGTIWP